MLAKKLLIFLWYIPMGATFSFFNNFFDQSKNELKKGSEGGKL